MMAHTQANIKTTFLAVFLTKLFVLIINLASKLFFTEENTVYNFIEAILEEYDYYKRMIKKQFDKNLIMSAKEKKDSN